MGNIFQTLKQRKSNHRIINLIQITLKFYVKTTTKHTICGGGGKEVASWKKATVEDTRKWFNM